MRDPLLRDTPLIDPKAVLPENREAYDAIYAKAAQRLTASGQDELFSNLERASAAGEPGLIDQVRPNYMTEEALVRSFAAQFGIIELGGAPDQIPEFTLLEPDSSKVYTVAVTAGKGNSRRRKQYEVAETRTTGFWKEIQTEPVYVKLPNPFFSRKRAIIEAQSSDKVAYYLEKELDDIAFTFITNALKTSFTGVKVWTFKDVDVLTLPTKNDYTSTVGFWPTLRNNVFPHFDGAGKRGVIDIHINALDAQHIYKVAPVGATLGGYSTFQEQVFAGQITEIVIYGHRIRIIPENWQIASGELYATVGPVFKLWLPPSGSVVNRVVRGDTSYDLSLSRIYEGLSPSIWFSNVLRSTWSTTDTSG